MIHPDDKPRLAAQTQAIIDRLRQGPATNAELIVLEYVDHGIRKSGICKYTSRISDARAYLREHGEDIVCERMKGGTTAYRIVRLQVFKPEQLQLRIA